MLHKEKALRFFQQPAKGLTRREEGGEGGARMEKIVTDKTKAEYCCQSISSAEIVATAKAAVLTGSQIYGSTPSWHSTQSACSRNNGSCR